MNEIKSYYLRCNPINGRFYMAEIGVDGSGGDGLRYILHVDHAEAMAAAQARHAAAERDSCMWAERALAADMAMAGKDAEIERLREALSSIRQFGSDTLPGRVDGPDDREWQRDGVKEMTKRAREAIATKEETPNAHA